MGHQDDEIIEVPVDLHDRVMRRVMVEQERRGLLRRFTCAFSAALVASVFTVPAWRAFGDALAESGFIAYASLLTSDARIVPALWQEFGLGVLESLPVMPVVALLTIAFVLLTTIRFAVMYGAAWRASSMRTAT